jgi:hypothetical protein
MVTFFCMSVGALLQLSDLVIALAAAAIVQAIDNKPVAKVTIKYTEDDKEQGGSHE